MEIILLAIRELEEEYIDENIFQLIYDIVKEYRIEDKLGYFMIDNVMNNDITFYHLDQHLCEKEMIDFDAEQYQF